MRRVKAVADLRRENLDLLVAELGTLAAVAEAAGTTSVYLSQVRNRTLDVKSGRPREMGAAMARRLEDACGKPTGWMDHDQGHVVTQVWPFRRLSAGDWAKIDPRDAAVAEEAYLSKLAELAARPAVQPPALRSSIQLPAPVTDMASATPKVKRLTLAAAAPPDDDSPIKGVKSIDDEVRKSREKNGRDRNQH